MVGLHFISAYNDHQIVKCVKNILNFHVFADFIDPYHQNGPVVFRVPKGIDEAFFQILNCFIFELSYGGIVESLEVFKPLESVGY